ncbi:hypothetical protein QL285_094822 [Trifolium repens]|nr:hypothetical protein QL285_094822 [Trifolium repens]
MYLWLFSLVMGFGPLFFLFLYRLYCFGHHRLPCSGGWWLLGLKVSWLCFAPVHVADWVGAGPVRVDGWWGGGAAVELVWVVGGVCNRVLFTGVWSVEICRFQVVLSAYTLGVLLLERAFMLAALCRELLALGFCYRVDGRSIRRSKTLNYFSTGSLLFFFCNLVSDPYAGLPGCA